MTKKNNTKNCLQSTIKNLKSQMKTEFWKNYTSEFLRYIYFVIWRCGHLCRWSVRRKGLHQDFHVLYWTAFCKVGVGAQSPGITKPLTAKDSLWSDDRISWTHKHSHFPRPDRDCIQLAPSPEWLTCKPAHELCDASHDLLLRECLHIFWLMTSNPTAQYVAIPDISSQNEKTLLRIFRMFHSGNIAGLNVCDRAILCVWRKVQNDLSVGLSTVKQLSFFIQDLCKSGFWGTKESYAEIILFFKLNCCILHQTYFYSIYSFFTQCQKVSPHLPRLEGWPHNQHPTMLSRTQQRLYCLYQNLIFGWSVSCWEGEEGRTV